jgi:hypothetical protein
MLDFNHILSTPGYNFQQFYGDATTTLLQWKTWSKPRGVNWVYIIAVGGGGGGSTGGRAASTTGGGGGGGGSGGQTTLLIPATFLPDTLYIQTGAGGAASTTGAASGNAGIATYVTIEPSTTITANMTLLLANGGSAGGAEATTGSPGGNGGVLATIAGMPLAGRGSYNFFAGQVGTAGGSRAGVPAGTFIIPANGLLVQSGAGGGGGGTTPTSGAIVNTITGALGQDFYPTVSSNSGLVASGSTPATAGYDGFMVTKNLFFFGGMGGGGSSSTTGGIAGRGGNGSYGCGGGGAGAINSVNTTQPSSGAGGPGFVYIISW